ncbi:MAG: hypothetical protein KC420_19570 [Myxococcales bacterium]|nr:hypothetical protein [Myxococcales bacterium]MCB9569059.1 hypothetical protein [Myxococcales bacterium]
MESAAGAGSKTHDFDLTTGPPPHLHLCVDAPPRLQRGRRQHRGQHREWRERERERERELDLHLLTSTSTGTTDTSTTGTGTTDTGTTGGTTGGVDCAMLGPNQCKAEPACMAITGSKINAQKQCLQKPQFLGCMDAMACGDAITNACDPQVDPPEPYQFPDTCIPMDWMMCEGPGPLMPC